MFACRAVSSNAKVRRPQLHYGCQCHNPLLHCLAASTKEFGLVIETSMYEAGAEVADC